MVLVISLHMYQDIPHSTQYTNDGIPHDTVHPHGTHDIPHGTEHSHGTQDINAHLS